MPTWRRATVNTGQQIGGSIGTSLLNTIFASAVASYIASHITPGALLHGRPGPQLIGLALVHGYTTAFWWSAAIFASGAVICGTLLRRGPLTQAAVPQGAAAAAPSAQASAESPAVRPGARAGGQDGGRTAGQPPGVHF